MSAGIPVFWLEPTGLERVRLRRFRSSHTVIDGESVKVSECPLPWGYHDASTFIGERPHLEGVPISDPDHLAEYGVFDAPSKDDPRWPTLCQCGYAFQPHDTWQVFPERLYRGAPDGQLYTLRDAPIGAMWDASWGRDVDWNVGPDGISLHVKTPGGDWCVDSEASNCTRTQWGPKEIDGVLHQKVWLGRTHYCWIRHGDPRNPQGATPLHVDKAGDTCRAGAGSILCGSYHGFLHHGYLTPA